MNFLKGRRAYLHTLGCRVNQSESAMFADALANAGFEILETNDCADLIILNSCALTEFAEAKTRRALKNFKKKNPKVFVCATGCYAQTNAESLHNAGADCVISNLEKGTLVELLLSDYYKGGCFVEKNSFEGERSLCKRIAADVGFSGVDELSDRMNLKIQDGCDNACAYCIIPRARGLPRSRKISDIIADARNLVSRGVREIVLTGINMSKFDSSIVGLCDRLNDIADLRRIAIGSLEPPVRELEKLAQRMSDGGHKLAKHFHISLQSASDNVLKAMRRKYSVAEFLDAIKIVKEIDSSIAIGTDIICGFPTETEEDFEETLRNVENSGLSFLHVFTYSARPNTLAAQMKAPPLAERKARADKLRVLGEELRCDFLKSRVGQRAEVLLENRLKTGEYLGYTENYIPCEIAIPQAGLKNRMAEVSIQSVALNGSAVCKFEALLS